MAAWTAELAAESRESDEVITLAECVLEAAKRQHDDDAAPLFDRRRQIDEAIQEARQASGELVQSCHNADLRRDACDLVGEPRWLCEQRRQQDDLAATRIVQSETGLPREHPGGDLGALTRRSRPRQRVGEPYRSEAAAFGVQPTADIRATASTHDTRTIARRSHSSRRWALPRIDLPTEPPFRPKLHGTSDFVAQHIRGLLLSYETRRGRRYYYGAHRVEGRVVKQYLGRGPAAKRAAAEIAQRRLDQLEQRRRGLEIENQLSLFLNGFEQYWEASERAWRIALVACNYHRRRGEWRRRRERRLED